MNTFRAVFYDHRGLLLHKGHEWFPLGECSVPQDSSAVEKLRSAAEHRLKSLCYEIQPDYWKHLAERIPKVPCYAVVDDHGPNRALIVL